MKASNKMISAVIFLGVSMLMVLILIFVCGAGGTC